MNLHRMIPLLLLLSACGGQDEGMPADENQIRRLSSPKVETPDPFAGARLEPLGQSDLVAVPDSPACRFRSGDILLVATGGSDSIARVGGSLIHLVHSGPIGPSGVFLEDRSVSISIGRRKAPAASGDVASLPARAKLTNRRTGAESEVTGVWTCSG